MNREDTIKKLQDMYNAGEIAKEIFIVSIEALRTK